MLEKSLFLSSLVTEGCRFSGTADEIRHLARWLHPFLSFSKSNNYLLNKKNNCWWKNVALTQTVRLLNNASQGQKTLFIPDGDSCYSHIEGTKIHFLSYWVSYWRCWGVCLILFETLWVSSRNKMGGKGRSGRERPAQVLWRGCFSPDTCRPKTLIKCLLMNRGIDKAELFCIHQPLRKCH